MELQQIVAATLMAIRVVRGNATEAEMDYVRWYTELPASALRQQGVDSVVENFETCAIGDVVSIERDHVA